MASAVTPSQPKPTKRRSSCLPPLSAEAAWRAADNGHQKKPFGTIQIMQRYPKSQQQLSQQQQPSLPSPEIQKARRTHLNSSSHSGSSFLAEMARTTSSLRPLGNTSLSMMVLKPSARTFQSGSQHSTARAPKQCVLAAARRPAQRQQVRSPAAAGDPSDALHSHL